MKVAEQTTAEAIESASQAEEMGASGLMLLPPMRYKADDRETVHYFKEIAESTSLPIMIYNNPVDYGIQLSLDMFKELVVLVIIDVNKDTSRIHINITS